MSGQCHFVLMVSESKIFVGGTFVVDVRFRFGVGHMYFQLNPLTSLLAAPSLEKTTNKSAKFDIMKAFPSLRMSTQNDFYQNA